MSEAQVVAEIRTGKGKGVARKLRVAGKIPAIIYGQSIAPIPIEVDRGAIERLVAAGETGRLVNVRLGEKSDLVLFKEVQRDPVRGDIIHADFQKVRLDQAVSTVVPVVITGDDERESDGGIVAQQLHELRISCLPTQIPEAIQVSVAALKVGESINVADLVLPEGVTFEEDPETTVVSIVLPQREDEAAEADAADEGDEAEGAADAADAEESADE